MYVFFLRLLRIAGVGLFLLPLCLAQAACSDQDNPIVDAGGQDNEVWLWQANLIDDGIFHIAVYTWAPARAVVGDTVRVTVQACGPTSTCQGRRALDPRFRPPKTPPHPQAGALMKATLVPDRQIGILTPHQPPLAAMQPVMENADFAEWSWDLHMARSGQTNIRIDLTPYKDDKQTPLMPVTVVNHWIGVDGAEAGWKDLFKASANWVFGIVGAALARLIPTLMSMWLKRRRGRRPVQSSSRPGVPVAGRVSSGAPQGPLYGNREPVPTPSLDPRVNGDR